VSLPAPGDDRARLEQICRRLLRPLAAQGRLRFTGVGRVPLPLKRPGADGTAEAAWRQPRGRS
jgi:hypothetical protein